MNKRCAESGITLTDLVKLEVFDQVCLDDDDDNSELFFARCAMWQGTKAKQGEQSHAYPWIAINSVRWGEVPSNINM